jgi:hypothetical protein
MSIIHGKHFYLAFERGTGLRFFDFWLLDGCWSLKVGPLFFGVDE